MLRIELDGAAIVNTQVTRVSLTPLDSVLTPTEFVLGTPNEQTKVADLTAAAGAEGPVILANLANFTIYYAPGTPSGSGLTTGNGIPLYPQSYVTLDTIGGLTLWAVTGTAMTAGAGLRVTGGYNA